MKIADNLNLILSFLTFKSKGIFLLLKDFLLFANFPLEIHIKYLGQCLALGALVNL